jgi:hypothetical protein
MALTPEAALRGERTERVIESVLDSVPVPRTREG